MVNWRRIRIFRKVVVATLALSAACGGNSGKLVADSGVHSAIVAGDGYVLWIRNTDPSNMPGAVNRLAIGATVVDTLVREGALRSASDSLGKSVTVSGANVYFTTSMRIASVPLAAPGAWTTVVDERQYGAPTLVAADADHVYWTRSSGIMSQSLVDGTQTKLVSTDIVDGLAVDGTNVYWYESLSGLRSIPKSGGPVQTLAPPANAPIHPLQLIDGSIYWLDFYGLNQVSVSGGQPVVVATEANGIDHFAVADGFVYWTSYSCVGTGDGCSGYYHLRRRRLAGGSTATIGKLNSVDGIVASAGKVFVLNDDGINIF